MKAMKIVSVLALIFSFSQCRSTKFDKAPPFTLDKATYTNWVGGQPGVRGIKVEILLSEKSDLSFNSLYFNKRKTKLEKTEMNGKTFLVGHFNTSKSINKDIILDIDPKKELKNQAPQKIKFPFELETNEAVISYSIDNKLHYYKLEALKEVKEKRIRNN